MKIVTSKAKGRAAAVFLSTPIKFMKRKAPRKHELLGTMEQWNCEVAQAEAGLAKPTEIVEGLREANTIGNAHEQEESDEAEKAGDKEIDDDAPPDGKQKLFDI